MAAGQHRAWEPTPRRAMDSVGKGKRDTESRRCRGWEVALRAWRSERNQGDPKQRTCPWSIGTRSVPNSKTQVLGGGHSHTLVWQQDTPACCATGLDPQKDPGSPSLTFFAQNPFVLCVFSVLVTVFLSKPGKSLRLRFHLLIYENENKKCLFYLPQYT